MYQARWKTWLEKYLCLTNHSQGLEKQYKKKDGRGSCSSSSRPNIKHSIQAKTKNQLF
jgi:hypothetical protein